MTNFGIRVYGLAAVALGTVGLVWGDFALVWQPVPAGIPGRTLLAYATGAILVLAGAALNWPRTAARAGAVLAALYATGIILLHLPHVMAHPTNISPWAGVAEQLALVVGGFLAYVSSAEMDTALALRLFRLGWRTFGACLLIFGAVHFRYPDATATMVPKWLPPGQIFWAYATGTAHIVAGLAILSGIQSRRAAIALTVMFVVFAVLVHAPLIFADPSSHLNWVMNAMNLALTGAAWIVADSLSKPGRQATCTECGPG
jgi:uncharacterized membrane protein YphA (DoxX/SURF4 family)